ncbi:hypothetical protein EIP91_008665 [Steccherinum ochraceum]|uniref:ferric-chelate reductase (NADPH) n=1 Tax=Steccherinum ochraceum TaxID=92696 RepID=A0A4V2MV74_9APHY|nr:hypothetical protein EIP91_008665 [Steccherinum ochraceum]
MASPVAGIQSQSQEDPVVDPAQLVLWINVLLLGVLGLATLLVLPRRLRRFSAGGEWKRGHFLYHARVQEPRVRSTSSSRSTLLEQKPSRLQRLSHAIPLGFNLGPSSTFVYKTRHLLRTPIIPGYSLGRIILMLLYFGVLLFAALFRDSVFTNPVRSAWVAVSQLPFVFALAGKNNAFSILLGIGYEKLNYLHRYAGRLAVLAANVHALGFIYTWTLQGVWTQRLQEAEFRWGMVALVSFDILFFFSLRFVRQLSYNLFFVSHVIALCVAIVAVSPPLLHSYRNYLTILLQISFHQAASRPYTIIAAGLYILDRLLRLVKTRITTAHIEYIPDLGTTLVRIPTITAGWRAGQHIRLRILSPKMGWIRWAEVHPYTIAGASGGEVGAEENERGLTVLVKKTGDWSRKLCLLAETGEDDYWPDKGTKVRVQLDGPYGGPGNTVFSSFSGAIFLVGGSGITFALAAVREILQHASERAAHSADGESGVGTIEIVWSVQHARAIMPLLPVFTSLLQSSGSASEDLTTYRPSSYSTHSSSSHTPNKPTLKISVYYTRAITRLDAKAIRMGDNTTQRRIGATTNNNTHASSVDQWAASQKEQRHRTPGNTDGAHEDGEGTMPTFPPGLTVHAARPRLPAFHW